MGEQIPPVAFAAPFPIDDGCGPVVLFLFLHAVPLDHRLWAGLAAALAPRFRVLAPGVPGFGTSSLPGPPPDGLGMDLLAEVVARADRVPGARRVVVPGAGHMPMRGEPGLVQHAPEEFLSGLPRH